MSLIHVLILGVIEGLTEFIPVSSTAQLLVGQSLLKIAPSESMTAFLVIIQLGPILALIIYFFEDFRAITKETLAHLGGVREFAKLPPNARMGWYIVIGTIPALVIGYFLRNVVEALFQRPLFEAAMRMLAAAALMTAAELFSRRSRNMSVLGRLDALVIGCFQVLAVFPGASRSGSTISGAMLRNFDRPTAARFSFLLSAPIMVAAGGYETYKVLKMPGLAHLIPACALGFVVAGIVGWLSIKWLLAYLNKHSLYVFSAYCATAAVICLAFNFLA